MLENIARIGPEILNKSKFLINGQTYSENPHCWLLIWLTNRRD